MTAHGGLFAAPRLPTAFCGSPVPGAAEFQPSACRSRPLPAPRSPSFRAASGLQHSVQCSDRPRVPPPRPCTCSPPSSLPGTQLVIIHHLVQASSPPGSLAALCFQPSPLSTWLLSCGQGTPQRRCPFTHSLTHSPFPSHFPRLLKLGTARAQKWPGLSGHPGPREEMDN